jgi:hypothetical protein
MPALHLATFSCDVTPPAGHPLCGGGVEPVRAVDDPLRALGVILLGMGQPVVLCALDWCGVRNEAHVRWRRALADAAHTVPENVALQCVHQHNAPFADPEGERLLAALPEPVHSLDLKFLDRVVQQTGDAVKGALAKTVPFTHIGVGKARVEQVASNRRILGPPDDKVIATRFSATKDAKIRDFPEGLIDPWLRTLSFWNGDKPLAALHYYATHPQSYYGDGRVTSDFPGLARQRRQDDDGRVLQVYFTGCAGNITAGKYNDGSKENRPVLRDRIYQAMVEAWKTTERHPVAGWEWRVEPVALPPRSEHAFQADGSRKIVEDTKQAKMRRVNAAFQLGWLQRVDQPIPLTCLDLGKAQVVHLPGEPFIEFQLKAQELRPDRFVCVAGYGDGGPGYIPPARAYFEGGYEVTVALSGPKSERIIQQALVKLMKAEK